MRQRKKYRKCALVLVMILLISTVCPAKVYAGGWVDKSSKETIIYGSSSSENISKTDSDEKIGTFDKGFGDFFHGIGQLIVDILMTDDGINLTIDGIVLGRMATGQSVSYTTFELSKGNPWGVIGSYIYIAVRQVIYSAFLIYFLWFCTKNLFKNGNRGRAEIKEFFPQMVVGYAMIFFMPYIIDYVIYARDVLLYGINKILSSYLGVGGSTASILQTFEDAYQSKPCTMYGLMYLATAGASFFYLSNYVLQALMLLAMYGFYPYFSMRGVNDKKFYEAWTSTFFPSLFIPLLDGLILLVPALFKKIVDYNLSLAGLDGAVASVVISYIQLIIIWSAIPARNQILQIIGVKAATANKSGFGALAALGAMALRGMHSSGLHQPARGGAGNNNSGGIGSDKDALALETSNASVKADADAQTHRRLSELNDDLEGLGRNAGGNDNGEMFDSGPEDGETSDGKAGEISRGLASDDLSMESADDMPHNDAPSRDVDDMLSSSMYDSDDVADTSLERMPGDAVSESVLDEMPRGSIPDDALETDISDTTMDRMPETGMPNSGGMPEGDFPDEDGTVGVADSMHNGSDNMAVASSMDQKFASQLSGSEYDRYENLAARDSMSQQIEANNREMEAISQSGTLGRTGERNQLVSQNADIDKQLGSLTAERTSLESSMSMNNAQGGNMDVAKYAAGNQRMAEIDRQTAQLSQQKASNMSRIGQIDSGNQRMQELQSQNAQLSRGIEKRSQLESSFAANQRAVGMSGQTFKSAADYKVQKSADINLAKQANYKNFNSGKFNDILTPEKKAELYKQKIMHDRMASVGNAAAKVVTTTATVAGAAALAGVSAYGGAGTMVTMGALGAAGGHNLGEKAVNLGSSTGRAVVETAPKVKNAVGSAAKKVSSYVQNASTKAASTKPSNSQEADRGSASGREGEDLLRHQMENVKQFDKKY